MRAAIVDGRTTQIVTSAGNVTFEPGGDVVLGSLSAWADTSPFPIRGGAQARMRVDALAPAVVNPANPAEAGLARFRWRVRSATGAYNVAAGLTFPADTWTTLLLPINWASASDMAIFRVEPATNYASPTMRIRNSLLIL